jgi:hypothetical protein
MISRKQLVGVFGESGIAQIMVVDVPHFDPVLQQRGVHAI